MQNSFLALPASTAQWPYFYENTHNDTEALPIRLPQEKLNFLLDGQLSNSFLVKY
jgi:hypothetical protein